VLRIFIILWIDLFCYLFSRNITVRPYCDITEKHELASQITTAPVLWGSGSEKKGGDLPENERATALGPLRVFHFSAAGTASVEAKIRPPRNRVSACNFHNFIQNIVDSMLCARAGHHCAYCRLLR
jgi:hypothetical protein